MAIMVSVRNDAIMAISSGSCLSVLVQKDARVLLSLEYLAPPTGIQSVDNAGSSCLAARYIGRMHRHHRSFH